MALKLAPPTAAAPSTPAPDKRSLRAEQKRSERREAIVRAAEIEFSRRGFHDVSISDVIDAADISRGTFYLYFESKGALFVHLIERFVACITGALEVVDPKLPEPERRIFENVVRVVDVVFDHPELTVVVLQESRGRSPEIDQLLDRLYEFLASMVEGALTNGANNGITRRVNEPVVATALIGAFKEV
ncbi:MAG TPA: TetR/AcrR family transcriptional regulator, partial [Polyangiales bacterium]|nr:TetR/AcrR family transcriptional regulator [Polyangiales bacterium]